MPTDTGSAILKTLEEIRSVFLGAASRHDAVQNRWVIAEADYDRFLTGPNDDDWSQHKTIAFRSFTLQEPTPYCVSQEQMQEIQNERPDARFTTFADRSQFFYVPTPVHSQFYFTGDHSARNAFMLYSPDAGFCLLQWLQIRQLSLKFPELVPYESIGYAQARSGSTNLPTNLLERWLGFLHILGWQNLDLSPIRAERAIWHENSQILGDPAKLQKTFANPMFASMKERIPFPPRYFASTITTDLNLASVYAIDCLLSGMIETPTVDVQGFAEELASIEPGRKDASRFHTIVKTLLTIIFEPDLHSGVSEERLHDGRGRIDIVFSNAAERGYFADLPFRHNIICPVVFFECKNYTDDIAGAEFAQLTSRFSDRRSKVGFIVCRAIDNEELVKKRCRDCFHDRQEHVVVLTDLDLLELLKLKSQNDSSAISRYLHARFRPVFMDA
jgi:hypothetical protein